MRARILAARQKTTEYRRNIGDDGTRVRRNPLRINPVSLNPCFRRGRRRLPAQRKRDVVRHSLSTKAPAASKPRSRTLASNNCSRMPQKTREAFHTSRAL